MKDGPKNLINPILEKTNEKTARQVKSGRRLAWLGHRPSKVRRRLKGPRDNISCIGRCVESPHLRKPGIPGSNPGGRTKNLILILFNRMDKLQCE